MLCSSHLRLSWLPRTTFTHRTRASGGHACTSSSRRLCVLRLPHDSQPRPSGGRAQQLFQEALRTAPATREPAAGQRRPRAAAPPGRSVYCLPHEASCGPAAATRAAAPAGGSVNCACHTTASRGHARTSSCRRLRVYLRLLHDSQPRPSGGHARSSSSRRVCVLRLPYDSQPRASGDHAQQPATRRLCVLRLPHESQLLRWDDCCVL